MASFAGLISGVLGGTAKAYGEGAQMEMKKQSELDLRKQLLEAESDKRLREDEIKRGRDVSDRITEEARVQSPEYLARAAATDLTKATGAIANRTTLAPLAAGAEAAEYTAKKPLEETKAVDAVAAKIKETTTLAGDKSFKFGKLSEADKRKQAEERLRGQIVVPNATRDLSKYERDAKAD